MKKKIILCVYFILFLVGSKFAFNYIYNEIMIDKYNDEDYSMNYDALLVGNYVEEYIAHYNQGNIHYQNNKYSEAITEYETALECNIPERKECEVRINLALAMLRNMPEDYDSEDNIDSSIETLTNAKNVLLEEECATKDDDGHSETAEQLKSEIEDMIEELNNKQQKEEPTEEEEDDNKDGDGEEGKDKEDDEYEQNIKDKLMDQQSDAYKERTEELDWYKQFSQDMNFDADGYIW